MNANALVDDVSAQALGFEWLRGALAPVSPYAQEAYAATAPFGPGQEREAHARASRVARIAATLDGAQLDAARDVARTVADAANALARASMGDVLEDANFLELQRFFDACERLDALTEPCGDVPRTATGDVRECARALERGRAGSFGFYLDDAFDAQLSRTRDERSRAQAEFDAVRGRAAAEVARALGREISLPEFIVMRGDLPQSLPPGVRVVREAPTYLLCELDADEPTLAAMQRRDEAASSVAQAEERVRVGLSQLVRDHTAALDRAMRAFGEADVLIAAARFTRAYDCCVADLHAGRSFDVEGARYVPLAIELAREGRAFTPIDVHLDGMAVLTGPNMGGKSVALRTCGFVALCAAFGVPVPAARARVPLFSEIVWLGIGADEAGGSLLSSFAREVVRLRETLAASGKPRLMLIDEFARTTTPREGKALLVAVIERLRADGALGLAATHLDGVGEAARVRHYAVRGLRGIPQRPAAGDLRAALEMLAASMDYTLEEAGANGARKADALALAQLLGIDAGVIDAAYRALEPE